MYWLNDDILSKINEFIFDFETILNLKLTCRYLYYHAFNVVVNKLPKTNDLVIGINVTDHTNVLGIKISKCMGCNCHSTDCQSTLNCMDLIGIVELNNLIYLSCLEHTYVMNISILTNLTYLNCYDVQIDDVSMLTNLTHLACARTTLDISMLTNLTYLDCACCDNVDLSTLTNLTYLDCACCGDVYISSLPSLTYLDCRSCHNIDLSTLTSLIHLDCTHSTITDISMLTNLTYLNCISCNNITDLSALTKLTYLDCTCSNISDISTLTNLTHLDCICSKVTDVSTLTSLTYLDCTGRNINGIRTLTKLTYLECGFKTGCCIFLPNELCTLTSLKKLKCYLSRDDGNNGEFDISSLLWLKTIPSLQTVLLTPYSDYSDS